MSGEDNRFDGVFMNVVQQKQGINGFFESVFGFLRRQTDFFSDQKQAEKVMIEKCSEQFKIWDQQQSSKKSQEQQKEQERKKKEEERKKKELEKKLNQETEEKAKLAQKIQEQEKKQEETKPASDDKKDDEKQDQGPPPLGNGGKTDKYIWTQTLEEVQVYVPIKDNIKAKMLNVDVGLENGHIQIKGESDYLLKGKWFEKINPEESVWTIEDGEIQDYKGKFVHISILKWKNQWHWWSSLIQGDASINTQAIQPENSNLSDLDGETRSTVEKMMFDMRQKQMGKPSSDELKKQEMMQQFMKQHPEMDFSKCKFN